MLDRVARVDVENGVKEAVDANDGHDDPQRNVVPPLSRAYAGQEDADNQLGHARDEYVKGNGDPAPHDGLGPLRERNIDDVGTQAVCRGDDRTSCKGDVKDLVGYLC